MYGPPGCGKTQLARAIAGEAQAVFVEIGPSDVLSKFVGESESMIRSIFDKAFERAKEVESRCTVLFFDEIDAIGHARGTSAEQNSSSDFGSRRLLAELLIQMNRLHAQKNTQEHHDDEAAKKKIRGSNESAAMEYAPCERAATEMTDHSKRVHVIVVAATNRPQDCDPALLRRFALRVHVGLPTKSDRRKILNRLMEGIHHELTKADFEELSCNTDGWSGSDLEGLAREAAMAPVRECIRSTALSRRRQSHKLTQKGGDSSCEGEYDPQTTQDILLKEFKTLRPVTLQDFENGINFWLGNQQDVGFLHPAQQIVKKRKYFDHYDSSSSSSESED